MGEDRVHAEPVADEDSAAYRRRVRFGHLPARVRPEELVETKEAEPVHEEPEQPMVRREWG